MKVCLVYREVRAGGFSIEGIFETIRAELHDSFEWSEFKVDLSRSRLANIQAVRKIDADVYHITGDCNYIALGLPKKKTVLTVHDIGHYKHTLHGYRKFLYRVAWWSVPLRRSRIVTAVSDFTRREVEACFSCVKGKVRVIHNPLVPGLKPNQSRDAKKVARILQIGAGRNKNRSGLIHAASGLGCHLVFVGGVSEEHERMLNGLGIPYEVHADLTRREIHELYRQADVLFFASTYEGFGMPILEAFASGVPVLTSNIASMPEVAGDAAVAVDPFDIEAMRIGLATLIRDQGVRSRLIHLGYERVKMFSPDIVARKYEAIYRECAS